MAIVAVMVAAAALGGAQPASAAADQRPAAQPAVCSAPAPEPGAVIAGPVLQVIDGRTVCVAQGPVPSQWVKVTLADARGAADRTSLQAAVFAKRLVCTVASKDAGGAVARCAFAPGQASGLQPIDAVAPASATLVGDVCRTAD
jgi:hypothetical protein